jgi:hypothetical protein
MAPGKDRQRQGNNANENGSLPLHYETNLSVVVAPVDTLTSSIDGLAVDAGLSRAHAGVAWIVVDDVKTVV